MFCFWKLGPALRSCLPDHIDHQLQRAAIEIRARLCQRFFAICTDPPSSVVPQEI
jgi:hypothetical protein